MTKHEERERLWSELHILKRKKTLRAIREARRLLCDWMIEHPDDYSSLDAGQELARMEGALEILAEEKAAEPVAA